jgi:hypothetical protein
MEDMIKDGWPAPAIAAKLGRSVTAIRDMAHKAGLRILRGATVPFQNQIDAAVYEQLCGIAAKRNVTAPTLARLLVELAVKTPSFIDLLLDDAAEQRNEEALSLEQPEPRRPHALGADVAPPISIMPAICLAAEFTRRPEITIRMH